jgi:glucosamine--fructose-6-phosphate aminotransferase (isomerizing)
MCGIVGCIGKKDATKPVVQGLQALEYRGYDSAGIAYLSAGKPSLVKQVGRVETLAKALEAHDDSASAMTAIGHTRWATHGAPTTANAHPHTNAAQTIFVVHNGIIENYQELKSWLEKDGYAFASQTDTEVIPHLIDHYYRKTKSLDVAFENAVKELRGAYAVAMCSTYEPTKLFAAKLSSPLIIGLGKSELFLASDPTAVLDRTKDIVFVEDYEIVTLDESGYHIKDFQKSITVDRKAEKLDFDVEKIQLGDFPNYMLKEIFEAPQTIQATTRGRIKLEESIVKLGGLESVTSQLQYIDRIVIVACGTSYYAGLVGEYLIEELAGIPVEVQLASEFKYRNEPFSRSTAIIAVSQSGETADTIAALKKVEDYGVLRLGVVNAVGSTITRMTDAGVYCHAGPEQAVASTKAFIAQVTALMLIALHLSQGSTDLYKPLLEELTALPAKAQAILEQADAIRKVAKKYKDHKDFLFIGRTYAYPCALEGALKLKEVSYIHAEGYAAGEMKHGPLAMIDPSFPTFALAAKSPLLEKTYSNIEEIRARKGPVIAIATKGNKKIGKLANDVIYIPDTMEQTQPILLAIVMQLFSYYVATELDHNVDRPRNLAKSVTVE